MTETLRAADHAARQLDCQVIFKGGTSLSKAFGMIDRFSEDVDLRLIPPEDAGQSRRDNMLKSVCSDVAEHLGIPAQFVRS
ncbi:MAG: nucleotidyl transferase AbiEii/AbiGii toxin family protein, partial [bacterium]|nr:nucleotidyl transferase AbiEii/AbiGii toxin family protein [bacterium]